MDAVNVIGGGLAGCEAAWALAHAGVPVRLHEMRPGSMTEVHRSGALAELVCSNSLKAQSLDRGPGLLKEELRRLGSLVIACAEAAATPGGSALCVDREEFAAEVERRLAGLELVEIIRAEITDLLPEDQLTVLATGPHTSGPLLAALGRIVPFGTLHFYDAVAPIVSADSIDRTIAFEASRYDKGEAGYLNCPMDREEYEAFHEALVWAEVAGGRQYAARELYEGCLPVEELARRGLDAIRYGPMKPVGLEDPRSGRRPWAVVQLRQENREATMYNLVGFQTGLTWGEQDRVFRMIPGLGAAEFLRYGVMHRNAFLDSPRLADPFLRLRDRPSVFVAGQLSGVEGYVESAMCGLYCGMNAARVALGLEPILFPRETLCGSLIHYVTTPESPDFQPMNANFGLLPPLDGGPRNKRERRGVVAERALGAMERFVEQHGRRPT